MRTVAPFFFVSLAVFAAGGQEDGYAEKVATAKDEATFHRVVSEAPPRFTEDPDVSEELVRSSDTTDWKTSQNRIGSAIRLKRFEEAGRKPGQVSDAKAEATKILSRPVFRDPGDKKSRNWLSDSLDRLARAISEFFERLFKSPGGSAGVGAAGLSMAVLEPLVWAVLVIGLLVFAGLFIAKFALGRRARSSSSMLLEEDEPDLNADEWLVKASELEAEGRFREAVRCLYLASLRRLDESGHLRFVRTETNWEHLRRFEATPERPAQLDLRSQTREFDRVWYGYRVNGADDVSLFREFYRAVLLAIGRRA